MHLRNRQQTVLGPFVHPSSKGTVNRKEEGQKQQQKRGPKKKHCWAPRVGTDRGASSSRLERKRRRRRRRLLDNWKEGGGCANGCVHTLNDGRTHLHGRREGVFLFLSVPCVGEVLFSCPSVASASSRSEGLLTSVSLSCDFYTFQT